MNIIWHTWQDIMREVAASQNYDLDLNQVEAPVARKYAQAVNAAVDIAWKFHTWPDTCFVLNDMSVGGGAGNDDIPLLEHGYNLLALYNEDPLLAWDAGTDPERVQVREMPNGVARPTALPDTPFYLVRLAAPRFGTAARSVSTEYQRGDLAYDATTGEAWRCHRKHTNQAFVTWRDFALDDYYATGDYTRRNGVLFLSDTDSVAATDNEPCYATLWQDKWPGAPYYWAPQRLPSYLLQAVIHGARVWLNESPPLPRSAMERQMEGWLAAEVDDLMNTRRQRFATGGSLTIL